MSLTNWENYTYVLPMDTANTPRSTENLWNLRPFLKEPADVLLLDELLAWEIPLEFAVKSCKTAESPESEERPSNEPSEELSDKSEESSDKLGTETQVPFLCIKTFPEGLEPATYAKFLQEGPINLAALLYRGSLFDGQLPDLLEAENTLVLPCLGSDSISESSILEPSILESSSSESSNPESSNLESPSLESIAEKALESKNIFIIYGHGHNPKIFAAIIRRLFCKKNSESFSNYKNRILSQNRPDFSLADKAELTKIVLEQYPFTYPTAMSALWEVYLAALPKVSQDTLISLNEAISTICIGPAKNRLDVAHGRLLRSVYSLPCNSIVYEDNGDEAIKEAVYRLENYLNNSSSHPKLHETLEALIKLSQNGPPPDIQFAQDWFSQIEEIRNKLLNALRQRRDPYISQDHKTMMLSILDQVIAALHTAAEEEHSTKNTLLLEYLAEIKPQAIHKYLKPEDGTRPFLHKGVAVVDTDVCLDEDAILKTAASAEKLILLGSRIDGVFRLFLQAALDSRAGQIVSYITEDTMNSEKGGQNEKWKAKKPLLHWIYKKALRHPLGVHIHEMTSQGYTIGIWTNNMSITKELQNFGIDINQLSIGTLSDLYQDTFDVLYWIVTGPGSEIGSGSNSNIDSDTDSDTDSGTDNTDPGTYSEIRYDLYAGGSIGLDIAQSKARCLLAIVGDPRELSEGSILKDVFDRCAGDNEYGKIYR